MVKASKTDRPASAGTAVTKPIGRGKAERFTAVEGMKKSAASRALAGELMSRGLKGDAYRAEVLKAFKKA